MADVAWVNLLIWPWRNEWLDQDPELARQFDEAGLLDYLTGDGIVTSLQCAMNGTFDIRSEDGYDVAVIDGEMGGGSYTIREETSLLETLRSRNIAFHLSGDAKYDWDGDEAWWYPGRDEIFYSTAGENGRFLDEHDFVALQVLTLPVEERVALIDALIDECNHNIEKGAAEDRVRVADGQEPLGDHLASVYRNAIVAHQERRSALLADNPEPRDLGELVAEWFAWKPLDWRPDEHWAPALVLEDEDGGS